MAEYRIFLVNHAGRVAGRLDTICSNDSEARFAAKSQLKAGEQAEVWTGDRCVGQVYGSTSRAEATFESVPRAAMKPVRMGSSPQIPR
jgi:hypothetical protein